MHHKTQLSHLYNTSTDQFLNFAHYHRILHVLLGCLGVLLEISEYLRTNRFCEHAASIENLV